MNTPGLVKPISCFHDFPLTKKVTMMYQHCNPSRKGLETQKINAHQKWLQKMFLSSVRKEARWTICPEQVDCQ